MITTIPPECDSRFCFDEECPYEHSTLYEVVGDDGETDTFINIEEARAFSRAHRLDD